MTPPATAGGHPGGMIMFWKHTVVAIACTLPLALSGCSEQGEPYEPAAVTRGTVEMALTISGTTDLDRDGVVVQFGSRLRKMAPDDAWSFTWEEGVYSVSVTGVKDNCQVEDGASREVTVVPEQTAALAINVICEPLGPAQVAFYATTANVVKGGSNKDTVYETGELEVGCFEGETIWGCTYTVFRFDGIEEILDGRSVKSAVLRVYATALPPDGPATFQVRRYGEGEWDAQSITWNTRPPRIGDYGFTQPPADEGTPMELDLTQLVRNWNQGVWERNGFQLLDRLARVDIATWPEAPFSNLMYLESDDTYTDPTRCPHLYIEFE